MDQILKATSLKNELGVSLVNALISIGLFGFLALVGATVVKQQMQTAETANFQPNLAFLIDELRMQFSSPEICTQNFRNKNAKAQEIEYIFSHDKKLLEVDQVYPLLPGTIVTSLRLSDSAQEVHIDAGSTLLLLEFYHQPSATKHQRSIKLFISTDKSGKIQHCYSTTGLADSRSDGQTDFWNNVTGTQNLTYLNGALIALPSTNSINIQSQELGLATNQIFLHPDTQTPCDPQKVGAIRYSQLTKNLQFCSRGLRKWVNLQAQSLTHWLVQTQHFTTEGTAQKSHGIREWDFCYIESYSAQSGQCQMRTLGNKNWMIEVHGQISCQVKCLRPSS